MNSTPSSIPRCELLAPSGHWDAARAAVANGADAIYFGAPQFNARMRAENFQEEDIPRLMQFLHEHGCAGYATLNVLVFTEELAAAANLICFLQQAGVDALIVQDLGVARLAQELGMPVHASTQMTITSPEGLQFVQALGIQRAVLARELSLKEIGRFEPSPVPLEVFVHGALCVAYSGQCLTSEALGQRSANRGECAQACRLPYQLRVDGVDQDLGKQAYLLSPQDLAAAHEIPELVKRGVCCLKIEGRLKSAEYVAAVTQVYRKALDAALAEQEWRAEEEDQHQLELVFSRGLYSGWLHGVNHQELVHGRYPNKRGPLIGVVRKAEGQELGVDLVASWEVQPGDGLAFEHPESSASELEGGRVYTVRNVGGLCWLGFGDQSFRRVGPGCAVFKTDDPKLNRRLRASFARLQGRGRQALRCVVSGKAGESLRVSVHGVEVCSEMNLQPARKHPLTKDVLQEQLGRLGETNFYLAELDAQGLESGLMLPLSVIGKMRRDLVARLEQGDQTETVVDPGSSVTDVLEQLLPRPAERNGSLVKPTLSVLARTVEQAQALIKHEPGLRLILDLEDPRRAAPLLTELRADGASHLALATPRILKAGEAGLMRLMRKANPDEFLVRNLGGITLVQEMGVAWTADFALNAVNPLTAKLLREAGALRLTPSYDLNIEQLLDLLRATDPTWWEVTLHQHLPMFHMEHCVFAAFMSDGKDYRDCGRPCEEHRVELIDRVGQAHPLHADVGCRNTVFHGRAQSGAAYLPSMLEAGVGLFRLDLLRESGAEAVRMLQLYEDSFRKPGQAVLITKELAAANQLGVTGGTLTVLR
ncbi:MAG: DUF3656 domain-containing protein [Verrucomicrobiales bacterium]